MPAKRVIILNKTRGDASFYRYVMWADVPAANQIAYRNSAFLSEYENATPAELQALRDGTVAERVGQYQHDSAGIATIQLWLEAEWARFQGEINAELPWGEYGRHWTGAAWMASAGVPMAAAREVVEGLPSFVALTAQNSYGANKFHFVLHNNAGVNTGQSLIVKPRLVAVLPGTASLTGSLPSPWVLRRRSSPTTPPSGGAIAIGSLDSAVPAPSVLQAFGTPTIIPVGGTLTTFNEFVPQPDEQKMTTADAPTLSAIFSKWGGQVIYNSRDIYPARPITIRAGETLEVQQSGTAGTGNARILCLFTVG